ncbi:MAG: N-acetylmuramoyl-L-alanine amidase [Phycisphaerae bacterium]|nr:N-acetylmuramoyl-L-alanine amidase [Phycisphaerae bacterium]
MSESAHDPIEITTRSTWLSVSRRSFLAASSILLVGCATSTETAELPDADFPSGRYDDVPAPRRITRNVPPPPKSGPTVAPEPAFLPGGVIPRSKWAKSGPDMKDINPMLPVKSITIHHEGWEPFMAVDVGETASRIEQVRVAHRNAKGGGYADIGYHFIIDREGRIWEGRNLKYQGAHVKNHNEGNVGIMCLGNFEEQTPTPKQLAGLNKQVRAMMAKYNVPKSRVYTHQEWRGASTLCPGRTLQAYVERARPKSFA